MSTEKNLKDAFAGESQARNKYTAFAQKADDEGFKAAAKLFRAAAEAEKIHALSHLKALGEIKSTAENLQAAVSGETFEFEQMYPEFIKEAKKEENKSALRSFHLANEAEKVHAELYKKALEDLNAANDSDYYVCSVCGHIAKDTAPDKCPICGASKDKYKNVG